MEDGVLTETTETTMVRQYTQAQLEQDKATKQSRIAEIDAEKTAVEAEIAQIDTLLAWFSE